MVGLMLVLSAVAFGSETGCELPELAVDGRVSVAWVSRLRDRTGASGWLWVVPTSELRASLGEGSSSVGKMLYELGLRRRATEPRRRWKVTVFDVRAGDLCRPVEQAYEGEAVAGLAACDERRSSTRSGADACGRAVTRDTGALGLPLLRGQWQIMARDGFCVLPAERFVQGER